jgi:hypothetical protein
MLITAQVIDCIGFYCHGAKSCSIAILCKEETGIVALRTFEIELVSSPRRFFQLQQRTDEDATNQRKGKNTQQGQKRGHHGDLPL